MAERKPAEEKKMIIRRANRPFATAATVIGAALLLLGALSGTASANAPIFSFSQEPSTTQAGGHPDIVTQFTVGTRFNQGEAIPCGCNDPKDIIVHSPRGVIANPHVLSICTAAEASLFECPADSQAGVIYVSGLFSGVAGIFRTTETTGQAARFVFLAPGLSRAIPQYLIFNARTDSDYGLDIASIGIQHIIAFEHFAPVFWGVPADPVHDPWRFAPGEHPLGCDSDPLPELESGTMTDNCTFEGAQPKSPHGSSLPEAPMTQNPTSCSGTLVSSLDTTSYDNGSDSAESTWPATTGCDQLIFTPSLSASPTTKETDSPSGLDIELTVPQFQDPHTPSPSEIRETTVTLPPGFSINPNAADGKVACSDTEARFHTREEAQCPEFSKVGTATLDSSALPAPIHGFIYIGEPKPGDPYRIILTANGFGTAVKLLGSAKTDPSTGQIVTRFEDLPESPFQAFDLHFFGSERGLFATPAACGTYPVHSTFRPWDEQISTQSSTQFFTLDSGPGGSPCPPTGRPFAPQLSAGSIDNTAAAHSPFILGVSRPDGDQSLTALNTLTAPGLSAKLAGVPECPESAIAALAGRSGRQELAAPSCPAASQVGTIVTGAGAGNHPLYTPGNVYLAGPYRGAPLSLEVVVPAVSGPYDLGTVAVRVAVAVDPTSAQVTTSSDPLPQILDGIPIRLRSLRVGLDRPGFIVNPTNCSPFSTLATPFGDQGASLNLWAHYQVANCGSLDFKPRLNVRLKGTTKRRGHPGIRAVLKAGSGESNISRTVVTLPRSEFVATAHLRSVCTKVKFAAHQCPANSIYGRASVTTPLLDRPLTGPVYLRSPRRGKGLPDLVADLHGQIHIVLLGHVDAVHRRLRTSFNTLPDAPVTKFVLEMQGGKKSLIENTSGVCARSNRARLKMVGQNGAEFARRFKVKSSCRTRKASHRKHSRKAGR